MYICIYVYTSLQNFNTVLGPILVELLRDVKRILLLLLPAPGILAERGLDGLQVCEASPQPAVHFFCEEQGQPYFERPKA